MGNPTSNSAGFERLSKRMVRQRGGQPGNTNAVTHGRHSRAKRAERLAAFEERRARERAWWRDNPPPKTDYAAICAAIKSHRREQSRKGSVQ
jgi:hypothetical protein